MKIKSSITPLAALVAFGACPLGFAQNVAGTINTIAGNGSQGFSGDGGLAVNARLSGPDGLAFDKLGNMFIVDGANNRIRKVDASGLISTVAGNGRSGFSGDGGLAINATFSWGFNGHLGIATDSSGNLYIPDLSNERVRKVDSTGIITTVAGRGARDNSGDGGLAISAGLLDPIAVAVDGDDNLYIAEFAGNRVRKVATSGIITTVAGGGALGSNGDGGPAIRAVLNAPFALAFDGAGNLYIGDVTAERVRKVDNFGIITTVAGNGSTIDSGDGGLATRAGLSLTGVAADSAGDIFISEQSNRIREVNTSGIITTIAGTGLSGFSGDGRPAIGATLAAPGDVAVDRVGNLYVADTMNNRIREVFQFTQSATPVILSGGVVPASSNVPVIQAGEWVSIYGTNLASTKATWNGDFPRSLANTSVTINGKSAYLWFVSPTQINVQAPQDTAMGTVQVVVTTPNGSGTSTVTLARFAPAFILLDAKHVAGIIIRSDGSGAYGGGVYDIIGPTGTSLGYKTVAAKAGDTVELFAVGLGPTNPAVPPGAPFLGAAATTNPVTVLINHVSITPAFSGETSAGLYQLNVTIPPGLGTGDVPLQATVGGSQSPMGPVISPVISLQ